MDSKKDPLRSTSFFKEEKKTTQSSPAKGKKILAEQSIPLDAHFNDRSMRPLKEFKTTGSKGGTVPGGVVEHIKSRELFLIKENKSGFTCFNVNELVMGPIYKRLLYDRTPVIALVESAMNAMLSIKEEEVTQLISSRIQQLRNLRFNPAQVDFFMYNDGEPTEIHFKNLDALEKHYIERLNNQLKVARECCKMLAVVRLIKVPDQENWLSSGKWLADLNGEDPVAWAKRNGHAIEQPTDSKDTTLRL